MLGFATSLLLTLMPADFCNGVLDTNDFVSRASERFHYIEERTIHLKVMHLESLVDEPGVHVSRWRHSQGSGFFIEDEPGRLYTAGHVIDDHIEDDRIPKIVLTFFQNGAQVTKTLENLEFYISEDDLAYIELPDSFTFPQPIKAYQRATRVPEERSQIFAAGFPSKYSKLIVSKGYQGNSFDPDFLPFEDFEHRLSRLKNNSSQRLSFMNDSQLYGSIDISKGMSGGPMLNAANEVIGILSWRGPILKNCFLGFFVDLTAA